MSVHQIDAEFAGEEAPFEMANLYPRDTGLPMTVWVSPRGNTRHDARVKVCNTPGDRMDPTNTAVVAIRPTPRLVQGELAPSDLDQVRSWIEINTPVLIGYWDGRLSTVEMVQGLRKLGA